MKATMEESIVKQVDNFRSATTFVFVGALILSQGIHAISELLVKENLDCYGFAVLFIGICSTLYGEFIFFKAKRKILIVISSVSKEDQ